MQKRLHYWHRIFKAYLLPSTSQLTFWHGTPEVNPEFRTDELGPYYMKFHYKADYGGRFDENGIPLLDYHGTIGLQYNPIAISQYGLGNYNLFCETNDEDRLKKFLSVADWLIDNLEPNSLGIPVWNHYFDFEYRDTLKAPWYSGLAQGLGLSVLLRAYQQSNEQKYVYAHEKAWISFTKDVNEGGVIFQDATGDPWIEEYIVSPPTHILNGFIWALWGVYDTWKFLDSEFVKDLFEKCCKTLDKNIEKYDNGYWSLYEQANVKLPMIASPFYHKLHIVQLRILSNLSGIKKFSDFANKWESYCHSKLNKMRAIVNKSIFKVLYY